MAAPTAHRRDYGALYEPLRRCEPLPCLWPFRAQYYALPLIERQERVGCHKRLIRQPLQFVRLQPVVRAKDRQLQIGEHKQLHPRL